MSDREDMGFPKRPDGAEGFGADGHDDPNARDIVPAAGPVPARRGAPAWMSYVLCAFGGAATSIMPLVASFFVGYGMLAACGGRRENLGSAAATCLVASVATSLFMGNEAIAEAVAVCVLAIAVSIVMALGRMTPGMACALTGVGTALVLGADAAVAAVAGSSISETISSVVEMSISSVDVSSAEAQLIANEVREIMATFWPLSYVLVALGACLLAQFGARLVIRSRGLTELFSAPFSEFDLPLWPVAVLVAAILGAALGQGLGESRGSLITMVSLNVLMALRFAFAAQGFAVLLWFFRAKGMPAGFAAFLSLAAFFLEMRFIVMSIVGLADFWLNLRRLPRGGVASSGGPQQQE